MMNAKGQVILLGLMIAIFTFAYALICIPVLKELIVEARTALNCGSGNLSTGVAATCLIVDLYLPYFIGVVIIGGCSWILAREVLERG